MYRPKTVIYLAVQNVEYWLLYLKLNAEGKNLKAFSLENRPRSEVKQEVYGEGRPRPERQNQVIADLTQQLDIDFLIQYSRSFNQAFMTLKAAIDAVKKQA
jgi:hypothetical protein